jgi:ATP-dependent Clp protease ATP-binding subunit ClpC
VDDIVVFRSLSKEELLQIVDLLLREVEKRVKDRGIEIQVSEEARNLLLEKGYDPKFGARPLRRTIQKMVEDRLADLFLEGKFRQGAKVWVETEGDQLSFRELQA